MKNTYKEWQKRDYPKSKGISVFSMFACGGGSTMGYKLAGCEHLGGVEIDSRIADVYKYNHNPKYFYTEDIRAFNLRTDLPKELYDLDILDGSPPCSTFSLSGLREKTWGEKKKFREGQKEQVLDDLVFEYVKTIDKLKPKVAVLENVYGIITGNANLYSVKICEILEASFYDVQVFVLDARHMGVPQKRRRVFFIARRRDLTWSKLELNFNKKMIPFGDIASISSTYHKDLSPCIDKLLPYIKKGDSDLGFADARYNNTEKKGRLFNSTICYNDEVAPCLTVRGCSIYYEKMRHINNDETRRISTFPLDYDFKGVSVREICGMSVPPIMMKGVAEQIVKQWF